MFKSDFKYYKSKNPPPALTDILNFNDIDVIHKFKIKPVGVYDTNEEFFGLIPPEKWQIYEVLNNPGLIFIRNPFTTIGQRYWIVKSIRDYSKKPNKTNLDVHKLLPVNNDWWTFSKSQENAHLLQKLRWATLGYHHNWDSKAYNEDFKDDFPKDLHTLCEYVASVIGYRDFHAQAAIVNYYHMDSTLSGHTDHSEQNLEAPLLSFSFGQTAIFLVGGESLDVKPTAMFLTSGDIVVMTKESRLSYHGIPKIIKNSEEIWNEAVIESIGMADCVEKTVVENCSDEEFWKPFKDYLSFSRLNINVRQVLKIGQKRLYN